MYEVGGLGVGVLTLQSACYFFEVGREVYQVAFVWLAVLLAGSPGVHAQASMRARYDVAAAAGPGGDGSWSRASTNDGGSLAWGSSYALMSFLVMFEATGDVRYLKQLSFVADGVLDQRDNVRGVKDYRGESKPCWQATNYGDGVPYCWAAHSGMIAYPLAELALIVARNPEVGRALAWDGETLKSKADTYLTAAKDAAACHDSDWRNDGSDRGYYVIAADASFTSLASKPLPLNMMAAMGRLHIALAAVTDDPVHQERARRLANGYLGWMRTTPTGGYAWNYLPESYRAPGDDISHAAINVGFAARAAREAIVFGEDHLERLGKTAFDQVYIDTRTVYDRVGGSGTTNASGYRPQFGRWLVLDNVDWRLHAAVRATLSPYETTTSGSILLGFALLAASDRPQLPFRFYVADWQDLGDRRQATAYGANLLVEPPDATKRYLVPIRYRTSRRTLVQQWDGEAYHTVAKLAPTGSEPAIAYVPYDPEHYFDYADGALFQFADSFVDGSGIEVWNPETHQGPTITSAPPTKVTLGQSYTYIPIATGSGPLVWSAELPELTSAMRWDSTKGSIDWLPDTPGVFEFTLRAHGDWGLDEQTWSVEVSLPQADGGLGRTDAETGTDGAVNDTDGRVKVHGHSESGCRVGGVRPPLVIVLALLTLGLRTRRIRKGMV